MKLNKYNLYHNEFRSNVIIPEQEVFTYPEKVLQFGTGVLLRGLPDYFISKANDMGCFGGRIVIVKSTSQGDTAAFDNQDNLYHIAVRGLVDNIEFEQYRVCAGISRVITARENWQEVLNLAASKDLRIVISNTTEQGISFEPEYIIDACPSSYPGKLLAVLHHRWTNLKSGDNGLIILPTELISDNGLVLKRIVNQLAEYNGLGQDFLDWLNNSNYFCNTLVDRIVPGSPSGEVREAILQNIGFDDDLLISAEPYALWAIEGPESLKKTLSFYQADPGVVITDDISLHKELKLRLLNGTHTLSCAIAILCGFETVKAAMSNPVFNQFVEALIEEELTYGLTLPVDRNVATAFGKKVADRFRNPTIEHLWTSISTNYDLKIESRVIPAVVEYYRKFNKVPDRMAFGIASYLRLRAEASGSSSSDGRKDNEREPALAVVPWGRELESLPGFEEAIELHLESIRVKGVKTALADFLQQMEITDETK